MRFPAVVQEQGVVEELLEPHHDRFVQILDELEGTAQFTLTGRYVEESVLPEVVEGNDEIRTLQEKVRELPEDASYYDRVRLGELIVRALEEKREADAQKMLEMLEPVARQMVVNQPTQPDDVINAAFLVERARQKEFDDAVEDVGKTFAGRVRLRLLGPLAPYDFVPQE
jgi:Gas vesicle synthesis protein GvpL/GvpF